MNNNIGKNIQNTILMVWEKELDITSINLNDDFFDIGGHSLKAINILDSFHKNKRLPQLQKLTMENLFEYTTIQALTDFILSQNAN